MNKKIVLILSCLILCFFISISATFASEIDDNQTISSNQLDDEIMTVENNEDVLEAGSGTFTDLNNLINSASEGDTVSLDRDYVYDSSLDSSFETGILINNNIVIEGNNHKIDGSNIARIFKIGYINNAHSPVENVILKNISFVHAYNDVDKTKNVAFAAVEFYGNGKIINCTFMNNYAFCAAAIAIAANTNFVIDQCTFINNTGFGQGGGAIRLRTGVDGLTISNSLFKNNYGTTYGGAVHCDSGSGNGHGVVDNCDFINNTAVSGAGGLFFESPNAVVKNSRFVNNTAEYDGGAIYWNGVSGNITNSNFTDNVAKRNGGAIFCSGRSTTNITSSRFINNIAIDGGAIYFDNSEGSSILTSFFSKNIATNGGGAIYCRGKFFKAISSNFTEDVANYGGSLFLDVGAYVYDCQFTGEHANVDGGSIYLNATNENITLIDNVDFGVFDSNFTACSANHNGGAGYVSSPYGTVKNAVFTGCHANGDGGAGYVYGSYGTLIDSRFNGNTANGDGGAVMWIGTNGTVKNSNFTSNHAVTPVSDGGSIVWLGENGTIDNCNFDISTAKSNGGVIYIAGNKTKITDSTFKRYNATNGGAIFINGSYVNITKSSFEFGEAQNGGAIYINGEHTELSLSNLTRNHATNDGGIIYVEGNDAKVHDSNLSFSYSEHSGGSIYINGNSILIENNNFTYSNASTANGGAIYINGDYANITDSSFEYSFAKNGGAIYVEGSNARILNSYFAQNGVNPQISEVRDTYGGSIYIAGNNTLVLNNIFTRTNGGYGGAIYVSGNHTNITKSNFTFTIAFVNGGAIYVGGENTKILSSTLAFTNATNGGAIYVDGQKTLVESNFHHNFANGGNGGSIYLTGSDNNVSNSNFTITMAIGGNGGAIYAGGVNTIINHIYSNISSAIRTGLGNIGNGGVIYISGDGANILNSKFERYNATDNGGALYVRGNNVNINESSFEFGEATLGGGIYIEGDGTRLYKSNMTHNHAHKDGGVIYINGNYAVLTDSNFHYSYANQSGGAIYINGENNLIIKSNLTYNNASSYYGGAIYINGAKNNITNSSFSFSTSTQGGAIYINGEDTKVLNSNFSQNGANPEMSNPGNTIGGTIFIAGDNALISMDNFEMSNAQYGGIIYVKGDYANITYSNFARSVAHVDGGAIYVNGSNILITHSSFSYHNTTRYGGAIYVNGSDVDIEYSNFTITFTNNTQGIQTAGGAIYIGGDDVDIIKSRFNINQAVNGDGGAIYVKGDNAGISDSNFTISLAIQGNGGAIYIGGENATISNCISNITNAIGSKRGPNEYKGLGGTVYISGGNATIRDSDFKRYNATFRGGSLYIEGDNTNITNTEFEYGEAVYGGTMYINGENTAISHSNITHTHASQDGGSIYINGNKTTIDCSNMDYSYSKNSGGAIYINGEYARISNSNLTYNNASDAYGGSIYIKGNNTNITNSLFEFSTSTNGGAIFVNGTNASIIKSQFHFNKVSIADGDGGTIYIAGEHALISNSEFTQSNAQDGGFIYVEGNNANITKSSFDRSVGYQNGGAIFIGGVNTTISDSNFTRHNATNGGAIYINGSNTKIKTSNFTLCNAKNDGGAIYVNGHNTTILGCNLTKYNATVHGGALYINGSNANITKSSFEFGEAELGGSVFIQGENTYVDGSNFTRNHAKKDGGIIYINGSNAKINNSVLEYSYSNQSGGAIYIKGVNATVYNSNLTYNNATQGKGGSIYIDGDETNITSSKFVYCTSKEGGAIYIKGHNATVHDSNFTRNRVTTGNGGTIYIEGENAFISYSNFTQSNAKQGGIIYIHGSYVNLTHSEFSRSQSSQEGGAVYVAGINATIDSSTFEYHNATRGGAVFISGEHTNIIDSNFTQGHASNYAGLVYLGPHTYVFNSTFSNSTATEGGAMYNAGGTAIVSYSNFTDNVAQNHGGAIYWQGGASFDVITHCYFEENKANKSGAYGGAIYWSEGDGVSNQAVIEHSVFIHNYAGKHGGAIDWFRSNNGVIRNCTFFDNWAYNDGGAIYSGDDKSNGENLTIIDCNFTSNHADKGGALSLQFYNSRVVNCNFTSNYATLYGGSVEMRNAKSNNTDFINCRFINSSSISDSAGACYINVPYIDFINCTFENCTTPEKSGSAIYFNQNAKFSRVIECNFTNCTNASNGGAICINGDNITICNSTFELNNATKRGGAIYIGSKGVNIYNSTFKNNTAKSTSNNEGGGAIFISNSNNNITGSVFEDNYAYHGGAIAVAQYVSGNLIINSSFANNTAREGAGIFIYSYAGQIEIINSNFTSNNATAGGAICIASYASDNLITNSSFVNNTAREGAGIFIFSADNIIILNSNFTSNNATNGGAVYTMGTNTNITDSSFVNNIASGSGAGIYITNVNATVLNSTFKNNSAVDNGGAVYSAGVKTSIINSTFIENNVTSNTSSVGDGGAIYLFTSDGFVYNSTFVRNTAYNNGGAIFASSANAKIVNSTFISNNATVGTAGAVHITGNSVNFVIVNSTFENNTAKSTGGAVMTYAYNVTISNSTFIKNNSTTENGGAVYFVGGDGTIVNSNFTLNRAGIGGGAIYIAGAGLNITRSNFTSNVANIDGGALYVGADNVLVNYVVFKGNNASTGSAIYLGGKNLKVSNTVFYPNRANSVSLTIDVRDVSYYPSDVDITITFRGRDNIANAIWNGHGVDNIILNNITYEMFRNGVLFNKTTDAVDANPVLGAENSTNGEIYQDDREDAQKLNVNIINTETQEVLLDLTGNYTDIYGNISQIYRKMSTGKYKVSAKHLGDDYYTAIESTKTFEVKEVLEVNKTLNSTEIDKNELVNYTITIKNNAETSMSNVTVYENLPEGFVIVDYTNSSKWTRSENKFVYNGILKANETIDLIITFNVTKNGKFLNNITISTNETSNFTVNSTDNLTVYNPNMTVVKTANLTSMDVNQLVNYTIVITNTGDRNIAGIKVHEQIPEGFVIVGYSADWTYDENTKIFSYANTLEIGKPAILNITFNATKTGNYSNSIVVSSDINRNFTNSTDNVTVYSPNMTVVKTVVNAGEIHVGDKVNFTINITNTGDRNITNIKIHEILPEELDYVSNSVNWTYDSVNKIFTYNNENLKIGESIILNITFRAIKEGTSKNTVIVSSDMDNVTNSSEEITILPDVRLTINKTSSAVNASVGQLVNFTIVVTNNGLSNATGVSVTDLLPAGMKYISSSVNVTGYTVSNRILSNGTTNVTWVISKILNGTSVKIQILVNLTTNGTFTNVAFAYSNENTTNSSNSTNIIVKPTVSLIINKTVNKTDAYVGDIVEYTIEISNKGPSNATNIKVVDRLDDKLKYINSTATYGLYNNETHIWTINNITSGVTVTLKIIAKIIANGTIPNVAIVNCTENTTDKNASSDNITAKPQVNLTVVKTVNVTNATVGQLVNFTIVVTNNGLSNATVVSVTDLLPAGMVYVASGSNMTGVNGALSNGKVTWIVPLLVNGSSIKLWVQVNLTTNGTFRNIAVVNSKENTTNSSNGTNITVKPVIDLVINKTVNKTEVYVGETVEYIVTVRNNGLSNATGVYVIDKLDKRLKLINVISSQGTYDNVTGKWDIGNITNGRSVTLKLVVQILSNGTIPNFANVTANENDTNKSNNNASSDNVTANPQVNLTVVKTVNVTNATVGQLVNFTIVVTNNGLSNATVVNVTDLLPAGMVYVASGSNMTGVNGVLSNGNVTWIIPLLGNGSSIKLWVQVNLTTNGTFRNVAVVNSKENTTNSTNGTNIVVKPDVRLSINKTVNKTEAYVGDTVEYVITVKNNGLSNATGVNVSDVLDSKLQYVTSSATQGTYSNATHIWTVINITSGATVTLKIIAKIIANGTIPNIAIVNSTENSTNKNASSDNVTAKPQVSLTVIKTANVTNASVGQIINFTITVTNNGLSNATVVQISDELIPQFEFVDSNGDYNNHKVSWTIPFIANGTSASVWLTVKLLTNGTFTNVATANCSENTTDVVSNESNVTVKPVVNLTVVKVANVTHVMVGDLVNFTITVTNNGLSNATNVEITDELSRSFELISSYQNRQLVNGKITWIIPLIENGTNASVWVQVKVLTNGTLLNTAFANSTENKTTSQNTTNITADPQVNLTIVKTIENHTAHVGELVNFTIIITNNALSNATAVNVTDLLPAGMTYVASGSNMTGVTGKLSNGNVTWSIPLLGNGSSIKLWVQVNLTTNGTFRNVAVVNSKENTTNSTNGTNITVKPTVNLIINKTVDKTNASVGDMVEFTITVKNNGPSNASGVNVTDELNKLLEYVSSSSTQGTYSSATHIWAIGNITSGATVTLKIIAKIIANGTIPNIATVNCTENNTLKNASSQNITANPKVNLTIIKYSNITQDHNVSVGDTIKFTIVVKNNGPSNATNVIVTDVLSPAFGFKTSNTTHTVDGQKITWSIPKLENGSTCTIELTVETVLNGFYSNVAVVNSTESENKTSNKTNITILPAVNIRLIKTANVTSANVGDLVNFTITITNHGPSRATNVNITDILPDEMEYVNSNGVNVTKSKVTWDIGTLTKGQSVNVWVQVKILANGTLTNVAYVNSTENTTGMSNRTVINATPVVDLIINKTVSKTNVTIGDTVIYVITVRNNGPSNATDVKVEEKLKGKVEITSADPSKGTYLNNIWGIEKIGVNETVTLTLTVKVLQAETIENTVVVKSNESDTNLTNNNFTSDNVTVNKLTTPIDLETENITYGDVEHIKITLPSNATGVVNVTVGNKTYENQPIRNGIVELPIDDLAGGVYEVTVKYGGDGNYTGNSTEGSFKVSPKVPVIKIEVVDIWYGEVEVLNVTVNAPGYVNVTVYNQTLNANLNHSVHTRDVLMATQDYDGKTTWNLVHLPVGLYPVFAVYLGNENYTSVSTTDEFRVKALDSWVTVTAEDIYVGEDAVINVAITPGATGNVTLTLEGKDYLINITNGKGQLTVSGLKAGLKDVNVTYNGDEHHNIVKNSTAFTVKKIKPALTVDSHDIYVGDDETITVTLKQKDATGNITITVNGKEYTATVTDGKAVFVISDLKAGKYPVKATYSGDDKYLPTQVSDTFNVLKQKPDIDVDSPDITVGEDGKITVTLPDDATGKVTIEIDGKKYTADVKNGKAIFIIPGLKVGSYPIKVWYSGDDKYLATKTAGEINVLPDGEKHVSAKIKDNHATGNPIAVLFVSMIMIFLAPIRRFRK